MKNRFIGMGIASVTVLLFLAAAPASAQPRALTLEGALAIAAERNRDIEKAREYIAWAQGKYVEERAAAFPHAVAMDDLAVSAQCGPRNFRFTRSDECAGILEGLHP